LKILNKMTYMNSAFVKLESPLIFTSVNSALITTAPFPDLKSSFSNSKGSRGGSWISGIPAANFGFKSARISLKHAFN